MKKQLFIVALMAVSSLTMAQSLEDDFEQFVKRQDALFNQFVNDKQTEYDAFRKRVNDEYAAMMAKAWPSFTGDSAVQEQEQPKVQPVIYEEKEEIVENNEIAHQAEVVVIPTPTTTPEPIAPVEPEAQKRTRITSISFYGTIVSVNFPQPDGFKLSSLDEKDLADGWKKLSSAQYDITLANVLAARTSLQLCDWGYLQLIQEITKKHYKNNNDAVFVQAYLLTQSGYKVRLAKTDKNLYLLISSQYDLFGYNYYTVDGERYYAIDCDVRSLYICPAMVDKERSLSLQIVTTQNLNEEPSDPRTLRSKKGVSSCVSVNKNQIDFFGHYPSGYLNNDVTTAWVAYANTPMDPKVKKQLYPVFQKQIKGKSEEEAVGLILDWVQTAFEYGYDDQIWGGERTFFATETLYYPYCDCEDRSILFSRIVRDVMHLPVILLYYPGHLATAVAFNEDVAGDYLTYQGKRYTVCDPTFIGAPVGRTMSGMDNKTAKIVVLE